MRRARALPRFLPYLMLTAVMAAPATGNGAKVLVDTSIYGSATLAPGSPAALLIMTRKVAADKDPAPLAGAQVTITLLQKKKVVKQLFAGRSDSRGNLAASFRVPAVAPGQYVMEVKTASQSGNGVVRRVVQVRSRARVLLVSDKPLYQPSQRIQMRVLALRSLDQKPMAGRKLTLEVEDPKGNKVFRKTVTTGPFGIGEAVFQLADEINMGTYRLRAVIGAGKQAVTTEKVVTVKRYVLPKYKVTVKTNRRYYLPGQKLSGRLEAVYFFGKPVRRGKVTVSASTFDVGFRKFATVHGQTDAAGRFAFTIKLPKHFVGQPLEKGKALVKLDVKVTDRARHAERVTRTYKVAASNLQLELVPEGGSLRPGVENIVYAAATYPDGRPAAARVTLTVGGKVLRANTDAVGLARFRLTPSLKQLVRTGQNRHKVDAVVDVPVVTEQAGTVNLHINRALARARSRALSCYRARARNNPALGGEVVVDVTYTKTSVRISRVVKNTAGAAGRCVLSNLRYRAWVDSPTRVRLAFKLYVKSHGKKVVYRYSQQARNVPVSCTATDARGNTITVAQELGALGQKSTVLLRTDGAIYHSTDTIRVTALSTFRGGDLFLDVVRGGQTLLTRTLTLAAGRASHDLTLGGTASGTLVLRAYRVLPDGNMVRDTRVIYVHPAADLKIAVTPDRKVYRPGQVARLGFAVTGAGGRPVPSAIGLIMVDESVYALQELQPGLEKVYFTLERELSKPRYQINYRPAGMDLQGLVLQRKRLQRQRQEVAKVLLARARLAPTHSWTHRPAAQRAIYERLRLRRLEDAVRRYMRFANVGIRRAGEWQFRRGLLRKVTRRRRVKRADTRDPWGRRTTVDDLDLDFDSEADTATDHRLERLAALIRRHLRKQRLWRIKLADLRTLVRSMGASGKIPRYLLRDAWGRRVRIYGRGRSRWTERWVASAGQDRRFGTDHDLTYEITSSPRPSKHRLARRVSRMGVLRLLGTRGRGGTANLLAGGSRGGAPKVRIREHFPETLLFKPRLITDSAGKASIKLKMADSITTWRLSAMANSAGGLLGSTSRGVRVFQDFFVDLDLPVALTQNDEVAVPVAIYNYLKAPQKIRLQVHRASWFEHRGWSLDGRKVLSRDATLGLTMKPNEVGVRYLRLRVKGIGQRKLLVVARGEKMSDAIRREIEVRPDGKEVLVTHSDRLGASAQHDVAIPAPAIPGASKMFVKLYPGMFSQVVEGLDKVFRMPFG